jgi:hypothetical protein
MDYIKKIDDILLRLYHLEETDIWKRVKSLKEESSTSSELLMSVTHALLDIIKTNQALYLVIGDDVNKLKNYCWSIGLEVS